MEKITVFCAMQLDFAVPPPNNDYYSLQSKFTVAI